MLDMEGMKASSKFLVFLSYNLALFVVVSMLYLRIISYNYEKVIGVASEAYCAESIGRRTEILYFYIDGERFRRALGTAICYKAESEIVGREVSVKFRRDRENYAYHIDYGAGSPWQATLREWAFSSIFLMAAVGLFMNVVLLRKMYATAIDRALGKEGHHDSSARKKDTLPGE
ncbi:hypothetical protein [Isoalcanivorax indicus]|uniref:hypothetical protein n=1 Tax=Isoalcanivorax indicus TaxID=2202653 RepID=UPI000DBA440A|nr:hypothetical protein [Isoalcanivorax indicus]